MIPKKQVLILEFFVSFGTFYTWTSLLQETSKCFADCFREPEYIFRKGEYTRNE
jgi:hypothetical protein